MDLAIISKVQKKNVLNNVELIRDLTFKGGSIGLTEIEVTHILSALRYINEVIKPLRKKS